MRDFVLVGGKELESLTLCTSSRGSKDLSFAPKISDVMPDFCSTYCQGALTYTNQNVQVLAHLDVDLTD